MDQGWGGGRWGWFQASYIYCALYFYWASLVAQMVNYLPAVQETGVQSLGGEAPLEKGMATHSSILAWRIPWTEEPGRLKSMGSQRVRHNFVANTLYFYCYSISATSDHQALNPRGWGLLHQGMPT